ncbi:glycosyltransferase [Brachybacterium sp. EE-P12]|uniref:glycosyltransferase n=1 Tax=Brachybacterium sp. EE-P12 TaxID=2306299 RepID=UPI000F080579
MPSPTFAIVSAVYGVARYLPEFFASLESQTYAHENLKVILVDDGSVDGSGDLCERWAASTTLQVEVIRQQNAGQAAARNAGIDHLGAEDWVTFTALRI